MLRKELLIPKNNSNNIGEKDVNTENISGNVQRSSTWNQVESIYLLEQYEDYSKNIGLMKRFKRKINMFQEIAKEILQIYNKNFTADQTHDRYKYMLTKFQKAIAWNNASGHNPIEVPFEEQFRRIANFDDSVIPELICNKKGILEQKELKQPETEDFANSSHEKTKESKSKDNKEESKKKRTKRIIDSKYCFYFNKYILTLKL